MKLRIYLNADDETVLYFSYPKRFAEIRKQGSGDVKGLLIRCADDENLVPKSYREWFASEGSPSRKIGGALPMEAVPKGLLRQAEEFELLFRDAVNRSDMTAITSALDRLSAQKPTPRRPPMVRINNMPMTSETAARTLKAIGAKANGKAASTMTDKAVVKKLLKAVWTAKDGTEITVTAGN